jgi:hypothetical protein
VRPVDEALRLRVGSPNARLVLIHLATFADNDTGVCWPSVPTLMGCTGLADRTVRRAVNELEAMGVISVVRGRGQAGNRYTLLFVPNAVTVTALVEGNAVGETALNPVRETALGPPNAVNRDPNAVGETAECGQSDRRTYSRTDLELAADIPLGDFDAVRAHLGIGKHRPRLNNPAA